MGKWLDLIGSSLGKIVLGIGGPQLKASSGKVQVRNNADGAYAEVEASKVTLSGSDVVLGSGANALTLSRNSSQSGTLQIIVPGAKGTDGYFLRQKASTASGVMEFELAEVSGSESKATCDTTSIAHGDSSPADAFILPANAVVHSVVVVVDEAFNGTSPSLSVGISANHSKYMPTTAVDLATAAEYEWHPGLASDGSTNDIKVWFVPGTGHSAGSARVLIFYSVPA